MSVNNQHGKTGRVLKENDRHLNVADFLYHIKTQFNEIKVASKKAQLNFNSDIPLSNRRDVQTTEGNATITKQGPEYRLRATATADDKATLRTRQRGNYQSGAVFEYGSGFRVVGEPTGTAYYEGGAGINGNRFGLRYDADGYKFFIEADGSETFVNQANWNLDTLDGSGDRNNPSGYELDITKGNVSQVPFVYYGYGAVVLELSIVDRFGHKEVIPCHSYNSDGAPAVAEPNLPIFHEVFSGDGGSQLDLYVGGRQYSVWGTADNVERTVGAYRLNLTGVGTTFVPLISFRIKSAYANIPVRLAGVSIIAGDDLVFEIRREATLTGASFTTPGNHNVNEIATQWDISATAVSGGETVYEGIISGQQKGTAQSVDLPNRPIYEDDTYTLCVRTVTGTNVAVTSNLRVNEDW